MTPSAPSPAAPAAARSTRPRQSVASLKPGMSVDSTFLLKGVEQRLKKTGEPFYSLTLADASGTVPAVMWQGFDHLLSGDAKAEDFVRVVGEVGEYNGQAQLNLRGLASVPEGDVDVAEFLATSPRPRAEMEAELDAWIERVTERDCRRLLEKMLRHPRLRELYCTAPAAARLHQAYIGGLLEHSLIVVDHAVRASRQYHPINEGILIAGALIHDIGKVREYSWRRVIAYTDEGRLMGHVVLGAMMADNAIRELQREGGFDEEVRRHLLHLVLSHHGKLEWGAPVVPKTREAMLLHFADQLDAFMVMATDTMKQAAAKGEKWTAFNKFFDTYFCAATPGASSSVPGAPVPPPLAVPPPGGGPADDIFPQTGEALWP